MPVHKIAVYEMYVELEVLYLFNQLLSILSIASFVPSWNS